MKWSLFRKRGTAVREETAKPSVEAQAARQEAETARAEALNRWPTVREISGSIREGRRNNHFAELLGAQIRRVRP